MADWEISASLHAQKTENPILEYLATIKISPDFQGIPYHLSFGDPSRFPEFAPDPVLIECVSKELVSCTGNGYMPSTGPQSVRETLAQAYSYSNITLDWTDVIIDIGGMGAIHSVLQVFLDSGDNILIPTPGYPLFQTIAFNMEAQTKHYRLKSDCNWEIDLEHLDSLVDDRTRLLVVVNPSNPCGTIWSKEHQLEILDWAHRRRICVMADEVYSGLTFGKPHYPFGSLTDKVPVITIGALSKQFLVPGWRCGWILIYDKYKICGEVKEALAQVKNMLLHPVPFIVNAIPEIFARIPGDYIATLMGKIKEKADIVYERVSQIPTLKMTYPDGGFYAIIQVDSSLLNGIAGSLEFAQLLAEEQGVVVMPSECFMSSGGFRVVLFYPREILIECCVRMEAFVRSHLNTDLLH